MRLTDGVILVRPWEEGDYETLARLTRGDPEIVRWTTIPAGNSAELVREFAENGGELGFVISTEDGETIGSIGLKTGPEVGYWVAAGHRGRGVAVRAVTLLTEWAFAERGAEHMEIRILPGNTASRRVAEKAGFALVEEGEWAVYRRSRIASADDG